MEQVSRLWCHAGVTALPPAVEEHSAQTEITATVDDLHEVAVQKKVAKGRGGKPVTIKVMKSILKSSSVDLKPK